MITLTVKGDKELLALLAKAPKVLQETTSDAIETSAKLVKQNARRKAGSPPIVNTGELARGIDYRMKGKLAARVGADAMYSPFVEFGRGPGRMPPVAPIERWARTKLGVSGIGFLIARKIGRTGTKPQPFFFNSVNESVKEIQNIFDTMIARAIRSL